KTVSDLTSLADAVSTEEGKGRIITKRTEALKQAEAAIGAVEGTLTQEKNDTAAYVEAVNNVDKLREKARREYGVSTVAELQKLARERDVLSDADLATLRDELLAAEKAVENMEAKSLTIDRLHTAQE